MSYTQVPNEILDVIPQMSAPELTLTMVIVRKTYGFHKDRARMTYEYMEQETGMSRGTVHKAIDLVEKRGFFQRGRKSFWHINSINSEQNSKQDKEQDLENSSDSERNSIENSSDSELNKRNNNYKKINISDGSTKTAKQKSVKRWNDIEVPESHNVTEFLDAWRDWYEYKGSKIKVKTYEHQIKRLVKEPPEYAAARINRSIQNGWQGLWFAGEKPIVLDGKTANGEQKIVEQNSSLNGLRGV